METEVGSKVSEFKLKLQTLVSQVAQLTKWKQGEEESCRKIRELEADLASSTQLRLQLQRKVHFLQDENSLLQTKHKELNDTLNTILEAKQAFLNAYLESTSEMKRSIESKDRQIAMFSEKINAHLLSLDSIRKEASFVKKAVDNAQRVVEEKEEEAVLTKEGIIETLISENKALCSELGMLETSFKIVQATMAHLDEEDRVAYSLILANQEKDATEKDREDGSRINHDIENCEANSHHKASMATVSGIFLFDFVFVLCILRKSTFSPSSSVHSESQPATNASNVPGAEDKDNCNTCIQQLDSECSTTQAGTS
ncbi:hypothetical protein M8C21_000266 [Ambrosia artemisiifolia]|uniref:Uncharacterized protein n=1 Tax=Ambrosia artemisiifolia TaxID=4212 RepID=A0AAD5G3Y6_AMBAR|nr:hypothetical protein M8C21_000266 [Ambrosia artemisiifolia]